MRNLFAKSLLLLLAFFVPVALHAQNVSSVNGTVQDATGAVIPGVQIDLTNPATGVTFHAKTNSEGTYRFTDIPPGPGYQLTFTHSGFSPLVIKGVYLNVAAARTQNAKLMAGANVTEEVTANSQLVTIDTEDATVGNNFQVEKMNDLPVQSRQSPGALFTLQPGITLSGATTGARVDQDDVTVDGLDVNDFGTGNFASIVANAPIDSVQEFRGTTAGFTAQSGPGGGGQFQLVTRSGTNHFHGNVNEYHRDPSTQANDWFNDNIGLPIPKLVQNQFGGSLGGPIKHDKAFFFFDYLNSRIAETDTVARTVPLASFQAGNISYINNNPGCTKSSRQNTTPNCISSLSPAQVKAMDPAGIGESPALFALLKARYPAANDLTGGDGVNTGLFRFNFPAPQILTAYVGKLDYNLTERLKLFGRGTVSRANNVRNPAQFPGDQAATQFVDRSYAYVVGANWQLSSTKINQFSYGTNVQDWNFPQPSNPLGVNQISFATGTTTLLSGPYASPSNAQGRHVPIPQVQDDFSWQVGHHYLSFGGTFKWIHTNEYTILDYNSLGIGLGGETAGLDGSLRPADLLPNSTTAQVTYDSAFAAALGRVATLNSTFNYDAQGNPLPQPSGSRREYKYYQTLLYAADSWKITPNLTLTYGLNYQLFSVPYEVHGLETVQTTPFDTYFAARVAQSAAGISGANSVPILSYLLGGPANHGPGFYDPDHKDFAPRFAFAYNPGFDRKTVFNGGAGIVYDRTVISAVQYQQDQFSYLFQQPKDISYGVPKDPAASLAGDPRFDNPPSATPPPTPKPPFQPYETADQCNPLGLDAPCGLQDGQAFNEMIDPHLRTPYSLLANFGIQHEFPGSLVMKLGWVGRYGRRLLAQADSNQLIDFPDKASGQLMSQAFSNIVREVRAGDDPTNLPAEPWFENQVIPGLGAANGYPNNTSLIADAFGALVNKGDFADTIQGLSYYMDYNVGMGAQFSENTFYTNKGFSSYNGLLLTVQKNMSHGLQFDANYTWSHSIDNVSLNANSIAYGGYGFICDALRPRLCRGNSDFDTTHYVTGDFTYQLPFGHGRGFGSSLPRAVDEFIGGWDVSGVTTWHSGTAYSTVSSAFVAGYANNAPAIFDGDTGALTHQVHKNSSGQLFLYKDPDAAVNAFQGPIGFQIGSRNSLRGPQYFDLDAGLAKTFAIWPDKGLSFQLRGDAFNVLNHPNFSSPGDNTNYDDITQASNFGQLTSMNGSPRIIQVSGRLQF